MLTSSSSTDSNSSSSGSPISQHPPVNAFLGVPRRRPVPEAPRTHQHRYYSTPMQAGAPDSTPLHMYGLEEREPSICEKPNNRFSIRRFSTALDDIKEDFSLQLDPRSTADRIRHRRHGMSPGSSSGSLADTLENHTRNSSRPRSILSLENGPPLLRRMSRRLSSMRFHQRSGSSSSSSSKRFQPGQGASISQPNLIGGSTQMA